MNRIIPSLAERIAAQDPAGRPQAAPERAVTMDWEDRILRARRIKTAESVRVEPPERAVVERERLLVTPDDRDQQWAEKFA